MPDLTDEQTEIISAATDSGANLMLSAHAGCGKTSTLEAIERAVPRTPILYLVFNKKNATEAADRLQSTTTVRTFNAMGHRIWAASRSSSLKVDAKKCNNMMADIIKATDDYETRQTLWAIYHDVISGVALAKALGYVPEGPFPVQRRLLSREAFHSHLDETPDDLTADLIDAVLSRSIKQSYEGLIDYNDQVYMPALFGGTYPKFPLVLVDEYQDLSPVNHALLEKLVRGRIIGVGDPYQNIYGFRGAKAGGMNEAVAHYSMATLPLSISFRCPSEIVKHVQWRVPKFRWLNTGGSVERPERFRVDDFSEETTIICRNNAPLFRTAMCLLGAGRSISVAGSEIGPRLSGIMRKLGPETLGREGVVAAIEEWRADKLERESKTADDMANCMLVFASHGRTLAEAITYIDHLFKQQGNIHLTTGHKAKGLEWSTVIHLDPWHVRKNPSEQDKNLDYVISTRSRDQLIEIESEAIEW